MRIEIIGIIAGILTTAGYIPQVIKVVKEKSAKGLSFTFLISMTIGVSLWLLYGVLKQSLAIILANGISLLFLLVILFYKTKEITL